MSSLSDIYFLLLLCAVVNCRTINLRNRRFLPFDEEPIDLKSLGEAIFGIPDEITGALVSEWNENFEGNPEELGSYAEGDILFPKSSKTMLKNGMKAESYRWPDGNVPYVISGDFNAYEMDTIEQAINTYHNKTCIRFVPRKNEADYLRITNKRTGCWSSVGRVGGSQDVNLQSPGCLKRIGTVLHEFMHAVGFLHEQNRPERDNFVDIMFQNIKYGHEHNFDKAKKKTVNDFGVMYDYRSVMHYSNKAFSLNGKPTIIPKEQNVEIGQRKGFSRSDIKKINKMYNCV